MAVGLFVMLSARCEVAYIYICVTAGICELI